MRTDRLIILIFILFCTASLSAQDSAARLSFFVGNVSVSKDGGAGYSPARINMEIGKKSVIKTGKNSTAEIMDGNSRIVIKENSTVKASDLKTYSAGNGSDSLSSMKKLFQGAKDARYATTVIAVRGAEADDSIEWSSGDDSKKHSDADPGRLAEMAASFSAGEYDKVIAVYTGRKGRVKIVEEGENVAALSYFNLGNYKESATLFERLSASSKNDFIKAGSMFYAGFSYNGLLNYKKSNDILNKFISKYPDNDLAAKALFLRGLNYRGLNDKKKASEDFKTVMEKYSSDSIAKNAIEEYEKIEK